MYTQVLSAQIDSELSTDSKTFVEVNFSENLVSSGGTATIDGKTVNFESDTSDTHKNSVDYEELLDTGTEPKLTAVSSVDDGRGNTATVENGEVTVRTFIKDISTGLNFVSFPIADQSNPSISNILPEDKVNVVWAYYDGEWKTYNPDSSNNDFNSFKGGYGYIIDANQEFTLNPNVNTVASSNVAEYPVDNGWNLIGQMQEYNQEADSGGAISSTVGVNEIQKKTDETSLGYKRIDSGAFSSEDMKPGNGYWMDSSDSSSLLTPNFSASQSTIVIEMIRGITGFIGQLFSFLTGVVG